MLRQKFEHHFGYRLWRLHHAIPTLQGMHDGFSSVRYPQRWPLAARPHCKLEVVSGFPILLGFNLAFVGHAFALASIFFSAVEEKVLFSGSCETPSSEPRHSDAFLFGHSDAACGRTYATQMKPTMTILLFGLKLTRFEILPKAQTISFWCSCAPTNLEKVRGTL